jgi:O-antigen ligase
MLTNRRPNGFHLTIAISLFGSLMGVMVGLLAGVQPLYPALLLGAIGFLLCFFKAPDTTILALLVLRSVLDPFSAQQLPAAFAIGVIGLTVLYVLVKILTRQPVYTDGFWWFFAGWVMLQGLWVILLPLGGLGMDGSFLLTSLREWIRLFSWLMMYLLVMQLKETMPPRKVISWLFLGLAIPVAVATLQVLAPSLVPGIFTGASSGDIGAPIGEISRVNGTLGLAATFATFLILFILLTWWKLEQTKNRLPWFVLIGLLVFLFVNTKSLFSLGMITIAVFVMILPRLNVVSLVGGITLLAIVLSLFAGSEFGQERLASISNTPLLNPNIDISRAVLLSNTDNNSFNWRLAQWTYLLQAWQQYPVLGYGLLTCPKLTVLHNYAHNEYVRALVEEGVVGLFAFLIFLGAQVGWLFRLFYQATQSRGQQKFCLALLAILFAMIVGMITENIWTHTTLFFYWWALFAVAGWDWHESQNSEDAGLEAVPLG